MPGACLLCACDSGTRAADGWHCDRCGWRVGDVPDAELPMPRIHVVYYLRRADRVKIGTSGTPKQRLAALGAGDLLALELGGRPLEQQRHREFADLRVGGEWFRAEGAVLEHIAAIAAGPQPWHAYARWVADALSAR
jgi:hypothetical protein